MKNKGFTLVELVAVVSLLGILLLFTYSKVSDISEKKNKELLESKKTLIINAVKDYMDTYSDLYPQITGINFYISIETLDNENLISVDIKDVLKKYNYVHVVVGSVKNTYNLINYDKSNSCPGEDCVYMANTTAKNIGDSLSGYTNDYKTLSSDVFLAYQLDSNNKIEKAYACLKNNGKVGCIRGSLKGENVDYYKNYSENINALVDLFGAGYDSANDIGCKGSGNETVKCNNGTSSVDYTYNIIDSVKTKSGTKECTASYNNGALCN